MICCQKLTKRYGKTLALDALDLQIGAGELHGFVGPNGAGKTTAMKILSTLMRPTSGDARVDDVSVRKDPQAVRRLVGYMPDFFGVYDNLKVWEYLDLYAGCMGMTVRDKRKRIDALLELAVLSDKREAYVDHLSRGMKQRLCLARALLLDPKLLILDEPASGMDPRARSQMREILSSIQDMGKTVLISSHILPELAQLCSHVSILERGKLAFSGSVDSLEKKMNLNQLLTIRFSSPPSEQAASLYAERIQKAYAVLPERQQETLWTVRCAEHAQADVQLLAELIALEAPICDYHRERATLEKVFLEVTGHEDESHI